MSIKGPYTAEFGAVHHTDSPNFIFTVAPAQCAPEVAKALNAELQLADARALLVAFLLNGDIPDVRTRIDSFVNPKQ